MIRRYIFGLQGVNIKDFLLSALDIAEVYRLVFLWIYKYQFSYDKFNDMRYKHSTMIDKYSKYYIYMISNKEILYKIIFIYLKIKLFAYPITLNCIKRIDYEKLQDLSYFYNLLYNTKNMHPKCFQLWWDLT